MQKIDLNSFPRDVVESIEWYSKSRSIDFVDAMVYFLDIGIGQYEKKTGENTLENFKV
jgi:hypothetical protein